MSKEQGPRYEMPNGISLENFDNIRLEEKLKITSNKGKADAELISTAAPKAHKHTKNFKFKIAAIITGVLLVALAAVIIIHRNGKLVDSDNTIFSNPNKKDNVVVLTAADLNIVFDGYNGYGTVTVELNADSIVPRILECMDVNPEDPGLAKETRARQICYEYTPIVEFSEGDIYYGSSDYGTAVNSGLYNGQKIKIVLAHESELYVNGGSDESADTDREVVLKLEELNINCRGLKEITEIDVFENMEFAFHGDNGAITAEAFYVGPHSYVYNHYFEIEGNNGSLSYGDEIKVYFREEMLERLRANNGVSLSRESCVFTVEQKPEYVTAIEDITADNMQYMINAGIQRIDDWAKDSPTQVAYRNMEYYGTFLYSASQYDEQDVGIYNKAVIVYETEIYNIENPEQYVTSYAAVVFEDIVNNVDGVQSVGDKISFRTNLHRDADRGMYVFGYESTNELITAMKQYVNCISMDYTTSLNPEAVYGEE